MANGRILRGPLLTGGGAPGYWDHYAEPNLLFENGGGGRFTDASSRSGAFASLVENSRGLAFGTPDLHNRLGAALLRAGRPAEAIGSFRTALELAPGYAQAYVNLGGALITTGRAAEGLATLGEGLRQAPDDPRLLRALAWVLATSPDAGVRDARRAVELAKKLLELQGERDPVALDVLAAAHAACGRFEEARALALRAVELAGEAPVAREIRSRLDLYEKRRPYVSR